MCKMFFTIALLLCPLITTTGGDDHDQIPRQLRNPDDLGECLKCADQSLRNLAILFRDQKEREAAKQHREHDRSATVTTEDGGTVTAFEVDPMTLDEELPDNLKR